MYQGLNAKKSSLFPVHSTLVDTTKFEWEKTLKEKIFFSGSLRRRFPFEEDGAQRGIRFQNLMHHSQISKMKDLASTTWGLSKAPWIRRGKF